MYRPHHPDRRPPAQPVATQATETGPAEDNFENAVDLGQLLCSAEPLRLAVAR